MPKKPKAQKPVPIAGYQRAPRYRWFEFPMAEEGAEPFRARVRVNLTFGELDAIPRGAEVTFQEVWEVIAPYIVEWNMTALNLETNEVEAVPPPAEGGWEVFLTLEHVEALWLMDRVRRGHLGTETLDERKNDSGPSEPGPDAPNSNGSDETT